MEYQGNNISNIFASGNTIFFLLGIGTMLLTAWEAIKLRSKNLALIALGFLAFWLPWAISPRIMFLYHYSPSIPFLSLALGYQFNQITHNQKRRILVFLILGLIVLNFLLIYPFLTGIPLLKNLVQLFFLTNITKNPF